MNLNYLIEDHDSLFLMIDIVLKNLLFLFLFHQQFDGLFRQMEQYNQWVNILLIRAMNDYVHL